MSSSLRARCLVALSLSLLVGCGGTRVAKGTSTVSLAPPSAGRAALDVTPGVEAPATVDRLPVVWHPKGEEETIRRLAKAKGRPVVVRFFASWCAACTEIDKTVAAAAVVTELERFEAVLVDATDDEDPDVSRLSAKYGVRGLPTIIVFDGGGKETARILEYVDARAFVAKLRSAYAR